MPAPDLNIDHIAQLARLALTEDEKVSFTAQLGEVLEHMAKLKTVDVSGVDALAHAFPLDNVWREDVAKPGLSVEEALRNAPAQRNHMVVVPPVVE